MQLKMFSIPALDPGDASEEMNRFLRGHRILSVEKKLVGSDASAFWAIGVEYLERVGEGSGVTGSRSKEKVLLTPADFAIYSKLRDLRNPDNNNVDFRPARARPGTWCSQLPEDDLAAVPSLAPAARAKKTRHPVLVGGMDIPLNAPGGDPTSSSEPLAAPLPPQP